MRPEIRAHRILKRLDNYEPISVRGTPCEVIDVSDFGELLGIYKNRGGTGDLLITSKGIGWDDIRQTHRIPYSDIANVELPQQKQSQELALILKDGGRILMPVMGRDGKFFDSLEFLRFLRRVIADMEEC